MTVKVTTSEGDSHVWENTEDHAYRAIGGLEHDGDLAVVEVAAQGRERRVAYFSRGDLRSWAELP